jgi:hypothetical protein
MNTHNNKLKASKTRTSNIHKIEYMGFRRVNIVCQVYCAGQRSINNSYRRFPLKSFVSRNLDSAILVG